MARFFVQLPDLSIYTDYQAEEFLGRVVLANVVSSNCTGYEVTDEEWSLLTDPADLLAYGQLKLRRTNTIRCSSSPPSTRSMKLEHATAKDPMSSECWANSSSSADRAKRFLIRRLPTKNGGR